MSILTDSLSVIHKSFLLNNLSTYYVVLRIHKNRDLLNTSEKDSFNKISDFISVYCKTRTLVMRVKELRKQKIAFITKGMSY